MEYQEALNFLYEQLAMYQRIGQNAIKPDLSNTIDLSLALGNPHESYKSIHVAGTNGKGSTSHMFASILQESGYKVGLYTSPHLKSFRERIRVNGEMIAESFVSSFVNINKDLITKVEPSFFEATLVMAFDYFRFEKVDFAIIETGLGGRLDSTNILNPVMCVITSISLDHENLLGKGIENIAREKGGIIKKDTPIVVGNLEMKALEILKTKALQMDADLLNDAKYYEVEESGIQTSFKFGDNVHPFESELIGDSLNLNVPTVLEGVKCLRKQEIDISDTFVNKGINQVISNTGLKGRWQIIGKAPITICDVGHNIEAVSKLMNRLIGLVKSPTDLHIVWGMAADKSVEGILGVLIPKANYYFCAANTPRSLDLDVLADSAMALGLSGQNYSSVENAYKAAKKHAPINGAIFIGGSTFVVAELNNI